MKKKKLPYLLAEVDSGTYLGRGNYGMLDGIFVNLEALYPQWPGLFYLPIVFLRRSANPRVMELVEKRNVKEHELGHLKEHIKYINKNPSYINRALQYNVSASTLENLRLSIRFEVEKVFRKEAPLVAKDYQRGETTISICADGAVHEIEVDNETPFIRYQIAIYLGGLYDAYLKKFPDHRKLVEEYFISEVQAQGRAIFGKHAFAKAVISVFELFNRRFDPLQATRYEIGEID